MKIRRPSVKFSNQEAWTSLLHAKYFALIMLLLFMSLMFFLMIVVNSFIKGVVYDWRYQGFVLIVGFI